MSRGSNPKRKKFKLQFSLRTLMFFFVFVAPPLGFVAHDIVSNRQQQQFEKQWLDAGPGRVFWKQHAWRFWRRDIATLTANYGWSSATVMPVSELPALDLVNLHDARGVSPEQFQELWHCRSLRFAILPDHCTDEQLEGVESAAIDNLHLSHPDAYRTVRRLRGNVRIKTVLSEFAYEESAGLLNDFVTMSGLEKLPRMRGIDDQSVWRAEYEWRFQDIQRRRSLEKLPASTAHFNLAFLGHDLRQTVCRTLAAEGAQAASQESFHAHVARPEGLCFFTTAHGSQLKVRSRSAWMADRVVIVVDPEQGVTDTVHDDLLLARVMLAPSCLILIPRTETTTAEQVAAAEKSCRELAQTLELPRWTIASPTSDDMWSSLLNGITLRPPRATPAALTWIAVSLQAPLVVWDEKRNPLHYDVLARGKIVARRFQANFTYPFSVTEGLLPGELVAIARGDNLEGLGVAKKDKNLPK